MGISTLMAIYRGDKPDQVDEAMASIEAQSLPPDDVVLVVDGPISEELARCVARWETNGVVETKVVRLPHNVGLAAALNEGLRHCRHDYVARMDADDVSEPHRFAVETAVLDRDPEVALVGGWYRQYDEHMRTLVSDRRVPEHHDQLVAYARRRTPFNHVTAMFRRSAVEAVGGYPVLPGRMEDWWLALYLIRGGYRLYNVQDYLVRVRGGTDFFRRRGGAGYLASELRTLWRMYALGFHRLPDFVSNALIRSVVRLAPDRARAWVYGLVRRRA